MKFIAFFVSFCIAVNVFAQTSNSNMQKTMHKGNKYETKKNYQQAVKQYLKVVDNPQASINDYAFAGQFLMEQKFFEEAVIVYKAAYQRFREKALVFGLPMATALCLTNDFELARQVLDAWKYHYRSDKKADWTRAQLIENQVAFLKINNSLPIIDTAFNMGGNINTIYDEFGPSINAVDSQIVFTRRTNGVDEDFYKAIKDTCGEYWQAFDLGVPINSTKHEGGHFISADGNYMFFMRCGNQPVNERTMGACDLYFAYKKGDTWAEHVPFGATINTPYFEGMPSLSPDNKKLYFVSDRPGGYGGKDIWYSVFTDGYWQVPVNAGSSVNSPYDEIAPYIANDNKTLLFASNGHPGFGGFDLFVSKMDTKGIFGTVQNLGYPINTAYDENSVFIAADGKSISFSSDRPGGWGGYDIYSSSTPDWVRPNLVTYLYGKVIDSLDKEELPYAKILFYGAEGNEISTYQSNAGNASFLAVLPIQEDILMQVFRSGYLDFEAVISFTASNIKTPDTLNINLLPFDYQPPRYVYQLDKIHFDKNVLTVDVRFQERLIEQLRWYREDTTAIYTINSYTDDSGTPIINEDFSYKRAHNVRQFLVANGVDPHKIMIHAWADADPIVPNNSDENRYLNRRVSISIRSLLKNDD